MDDSEPWHLTILRSQGVHILRPERSWRPIVTVDVDHHPQHEVQLGSDGQNPNRRLAFHLHNVDVRTKIQIQVWHKSQSKKKGKRRNLVATANVCLGDTLKQLGPNANNETEFDVRLSSVARQNADSRRIRGQRSGASLCLHLRAPSSFSSSSSTTTLVEDDEYYKSDALTEHGYTTEAPTTRDASPIKPELPIRPVLPPLPESTLRRRHRKGARGYDVGADSDEDSGLSDGQACSSQGDPPCYSELEHEDCTVDESPVPPFTGPSYWFAASIIPRFSGDNISIESHRSRVENALDSFTPYGELRRAQEMQDDPEFERVLDRLRTEWLAVGASLVALAGLDAAVFGFSTDSLFPIDSFAKDVVALSSIASGVGLFTSAWFLTLYSFQDARRFQSRALDLYGTYFFFCLSCRLPTLCMTVSACSLMLFLFRVAWATWKTATLVISFLAGVIVSLQYLVYGVHAIVRLFLRVGGAGRRFFLHFARRASLSAADAEAGSAVAATIVEKGGVVEKAPVHTSPFDRRPCAIGAALDEMAMPVVDDKLTEEPLQEEDVTGSGRVPVSS